MNNPVMHFTCLLHETQSRRWLRTLVLALLCSSLPETVALADEGFIVEVVASPAPIKLGERVLATVPRGTRLWVFKMRGTHWAGVKVPGREERGWMHQSHFRRLRLSPEEQWRLDLAQSRYDQAVELRVKGDTVLAIEAIEECLAHWQAVLGSQHPNTLLAVNELAHLIGSRGQYAMAARLQEQALRDATALLGERHRYTLVTANNLGNSLGLLGKLAEARSILERTVAARQQVLGDEHPETLSSINNLAVIMDGLGDAATAQRLFEQALSGRRRVRGQSHPETLDTQGNLANLLASAGDHAAALAIQEQVLAAHREALGEENLRTLISMSSLADLRVAVGDDQAARELYEQGLATAREILGESHPHTLVTQFNLAKWHARASDPTAAQALFERLLPQLIATFGKSHSVTRGAQLYMAELLGQGGRPADALPLLSDLREASHDYHVRLLPSLTGREQLAYLQRTGMPELARCLSFVRRHPATKEGVELAAVWLANSKGVGHEALTQQSRWRHDPATDKDRERLEELIHVRRQLAQASFLTGTRASVQDLQLLAHLSQREAELSRMVPFGALQGAPMVSIDQLRESIPPGSVLIDMARFQGWEVAESSDRPSWGEAVYMAWIVPPSGAGEIQVVDLGPAKPIEQAVLAARTAVDRSFQQTLTDGEIASEHMVRQALGNLADLVFAPLERHLNEVTELILCPDGDLWLVPWGALPLDEPRYLIEQYKLRHVVRGRDVVATPRHSLRMNSAYIMANPNFDLTPGDSLKTQQEFFGKRIVSRSQAETIAGRGKLPRVDRLPWTALEAEAIQSPLEIYSRAKPEVFLDDLAQESLFHSRIRPRAIVFSTHAFYLPGPPTQPIDPLTPPIFEPLSAASTVAGEPLQNPLLRCGLLLTGCNHSAENIATGLDDGILTGLEIVGADLRGTELIVLSACDSGLGEIQQGDGVAGLRQAFLLAGAESVVAALWEVPDLQTAQLMPDFFEFLAAGQSQADALRSAQLARIASRRERFGAAQPYFWAAFTVTGQVVHAHDLAPDTAPFEAASLSADQHRPAGEVRQDNRLELPLVWIPPGAFLMGSPDTVTGAPVKSQVEVTLSRGFWLGQTEVTQRQWQTVIGTRPWTEDARVRVGPTFPATFVDWEGAVAFCRKLTEDERAGNRLEADWEYTLPTEAQWEYACRAATTTQFHFGNEPFRLREYGWYDKNARDVEERYPHRVGQKRANPWGLYDMHGNVLEWCLDWYADKLPGGRDPRVDEGSRRVVRGGCWYYPALGCASDSRFSSPPSLGSESTGFRVVLAPIARDPGIPAQ